MRSTLVSMFCLRSMQMCGSPDDLLQINIWFTQPVGSSTLFRTPLASKTCSYRSNRFLTAYGTHPITSTMGSALPLITGEIIPGNSPNIQRYVKYREKRNNRGTKPNSSLPQTNRQEWGRSPGRLKRNSWLKIDDLEDCLSSRMNLST